MLELAGTVATEDQTSFGKRVQFSFADRAILSEATVRSLLYTFRESKPAKAAYLVASRNWR